jgi:hypothetical protein
VLFPTPVSEELNSSFSVSHGNRIFFCRISVFGFGPGNFVDRIGLDPRWQAFSVPKFPVLPVLGNPGGSKTIRRSSLVLSRGFVEHFLLSPGELELELQQILTKPSTSTALADTR